MELRKIKSSAGRKFIYIPQNSDLQVGDNVAVVKIELNAEIVGLSAKNEPTSPAPVKANE